MDVVVWNVEYVVCIDDVFVVERICEMLIGGEEIGVGCVDC